MMLLFKRTEGPTGKQEVTKLEQEPILPGGDCRLTCSRLGYYTESLKCKCIESHWRIEAFREANMNFSAFMFVSASLLRKEAENRVCLRLAVWLLQTDCSCFYATNTEVLSD